jgi:hypothetical protein
MADGPGKADESEPKRLGARLSVWSIVSLILPLLAAPFIVLAYQIMPTGPGVGPAGGPAIALVLFSCLAGALCLTLVGAIAGCVGGFRSGGHRLAWVGFVLNSLLGALVIAVPAYSLHRSHW